MARTKFTQSIADEICCQLVEGKSLAEICRGPDMPKYRTVFGWLSDNESFSQDYMRAREAQADADADAIGDIASRVLHGEIEPGAARVAIDALKWTAGKRKPKVYGEKLDIDHSNKDGTLAALFASIAATGKTINGDD